MTFDWLKGFQQDMQKPDNYAEKTLAAYRLGIKAKGSIVGVSITVDDQGCAACHALDPNAVYHPDDAPRLPLPECDRGQACRCVYRPVMAYQIDEQG